jgi:hypothetical protein
MYFREGHEGDNNLSTCDFFSGVHLEEKKKSCFVGVMGLKVNIGFISVDRWNFT